MSARQTNLMFMSTGLDFTLTPWLHKAWLMADFQFDVCRAGNPSGQDSPTDEAAVTEALRVELKDLSSLCPVAVTWLWLVMWLDCLETCSPLMHCGMRPWIQWNNLYPKWILGHLQWKSYYIWSIFFFFSLVLDLISNTGAKSCILFYINAK